MASKTISTILNLKDNFSETIKKTTSNTTAFANEIKKTQSELTKLKSGTSSIFTNTGAKIAGLVGGLGIAEFARESLILASDLSEVQNVVDTTFTDSADKINDFSKTTAEQFGISELQAKKYAGTLGAMFQSAGITGDELTNMSTSLAGLSGDLASFYNLDPDEAFDKIKSGISGMVEPLRSIGVSVDETTVSTYAAANGFTKQWKDATQAEKEMWRYKSIMEQTKKAQGDYNKTADSFANQLRTLKLNLQTFGAKIMGSTIPAFQDLFKSVNNFITGIDVQSFMNNFSNAISNIKPSFDNFVDSIKNLGSTILNSVEPAFDSIKPDSWDSVSDAIKDVLDKATEVANFIKDNWPTILSTVKNITAAVIAWKLATIATNTWIKIVSATTKAWETIELIIWGIKNATNAWEAAQWALNVAMDTNPVGVITLAIGALGYAIYEVVIHWQEIWGWINKVWDVINSNPILLFISYAINPLGTALMELITHWDDICSSVQWAWDKLKGFWDWWNGTSFTDKTVNINENTKTTTDGAAVTVDSGNDDVGANATGTQYWRGGPTMVGEHGPELVNLPSGSKVYTASETKSMVNGNSGGHTFIINFNGNVGSEEFFNQAGQHIFNQVKLAMINS